MLIGNEEVTYQQMSGVDAGVLLACDLLRQYCRRTIDDSPAELVLDALRAAVEQERNGTPIRSSPYVTRLAHRVTDRLVRGGEMPE